MNDLTNLVFDQRIREAQAMLCTVRHHRRVIDGLGSVYGELYLKLYYMVKEIDEKKGE